MTLLPELPFWAEVLVFVASAAIIWVAGIWLSKYTDVLSSRLHLGQALGGLILLAVATNLPEIAITYSASASGHVDVAVSNILGGIAIQTVVLVALDAFGVREKRPLTYQAASLTLVIEGAVVLAVLAVVVMGTQLPADLVFFRLSPDVVLIAAVWVAGLVLTKRAARKLPWTGNGEAPDSQSRPRGHSQEATASKAKGTSTVKAVAVFAAAALATLVAGVLAEESGTAAADHVGLSGVLFGATVLAAATSLPELSTGLTSTKAGDYKLAFGDIFGGNAFLPVLFLLAVLVSGTSVLPGAHASDIYLTGLGALLTVVYMAGLVFRPAKQHARLGIDSIAVLVLYLAGVAGLIALSG
ncbi:sodium:calcium antiporter [Tessaracoccus antarcticus]|uniref:Sodium:calcium antiporter n=1 Tax=Tessaracoccus antarcticus TaxID=2479848 RepID=A0A3M0G9D4_9ACTN|nr:sodium:calcium antiporter [Tessaracoccus antarcticus]RMB61564.1 sodium:calcium antiporter [Tessaracoccus antarcticus]